MRAKDNICLVWFFSIACVFILLGVGLAQTPTQPAPVRLGKVEYKAEDLDDPFGWQEVKEPVKEEKVELRPAPSLTIQGLVWGGHFPQAIVNNKVLRVGDTIEGARIVDINKEGVVLYFDGQQYNITSPGIMLTSRISDTKTEGGVDEK